MKVLFIISIFAFVVGVSSGLLYLNNERESESPFAKMDVGGDFTLSAGDEVISLSDFKDNVVLIFFGYTSCPDVCPTTLTSIAAALNKLSISELKEVQVLFISVDPERDTAEKLKGFTEYFHPNILGVSGTKQAIDKVVKQYASAYSKVKNGSEVGYLVDHSSAIYVVDQDGQLVNMLAGDAEVSTVVKMIRQFMY